MTNASQAAVKAANARMTAIKDSLYHALLPLKGAVDVEQGASDALKEAKDQGINVREQVMGNLADLATAGNWSTQDIDAAATMVCAKGGAGNSDLPKTVQTFIGEAKRAMHPAVRQDFAEIVAIRDAAWQDEVDTLARDKKAPAPIKKAFARKYHLLVTLLGEGAKGTCPASTAEVIEFAKRRDPDIDADKAFKVLERIKEQLGTMAGNFPDQDLVAAVDVLNKVMTSKQMQDARDRDLGEPNDAPAPVAAPAATPNSVISTNDEPAEGAVDVLDAILNSDLGVAA